ncbi:hypothetical protein [Streptococcus parauberis]|uniref:hypothetical protein n=1 Tax=Streptococcus parauberis TaxID=1348 RepID=UPI000C51BA8B|nr:hypothetical protein [Streptococcus parauberis]PIA83237.1 hypothetical protein ADO07_01706 [Streptococcus parauberis]
MNEERNQYKMKMIFISLLTVAVLAGCSETAEETPRTNSPDETTAVTQSTSDTSDSSTPNIIEPLIITFSPEFTLGDLIDFGGAFLGVIGAFLVARYSEKKLKERELKEKEPVLRIGAIQESIEGYKQGFDLSDEGIELKDIESKFSELSIPIANLGITPITDIVYYSYIQNYSEIVEKSQLGNNDLKFSQIGNGNSEKYELGLLYRVGNSINKFSFKNEKYVTTIPYLFPKETDDIFFQKDIIAILGYYFSEIYPTIPVPEIIINVNFTDYLGIKQTQEFILKLERNLSNFVLSSKEDNENYTDISFRLIGKLKRSLKN